MLVRLFRSHQPILLLVIPVIGLLLWIPAFFHPTVPELKHQMPLYELLVKPLLAYPLLCTFTAFFLLITQAFLFNYIVDKYELTGKRSYLPVLLYLIFTSFSPELLQLHPLSFANIFILIAVSRLLSTYRNNSVISPCFDAGFLIAIAALFYFPAVVMIIFILVGVIVLLPFSLRNWAIVLLGFLLPFIYSVVWFFWVDKLEYLADDRVLYPIVNHATSLNSDMAQLYFELIFFVVLAAILSIGRGADERNRSVQHRSNLSVLRWMFVFGALMLLISPSLSYMHFFVALTPLLVLITGYFLWARIVWISEIVLWILILSIGYNYFSISP